MAAYDDKDRSGKWLIQHHGGAILWLARVHGFRAWRPGQAEVVQPRQLPDGLLEVFFEGRAGPDPFVVEIFTYPKREADEQVLRDAVLVLADRRVLPEVITLILQPRGAYRVAGSQRLASRLGCTELTLNWRVVELWTLSAADLLAAGDVGLVPWAPLAQFDGPPEALIQECRERIDRQARPPERANLLAVTQVMARLRYNDPALLSLLGGSQAMIESPLIQELMAKTRQED